MNTFEKWAARALPWVIFAALFVLVVTAAYDVYSTKSFTFSRLALYIAVLVLVVAGGAWATGTDRRNAARAEQAKAAQATAARATAGQATAGQATAGQPPTERPPKSTKRGMSVRFSFALMPWLVLVLLVLFVLASIAGIAGFFGEPALEKPQLLPFAMLTVLALAFGIWFIICFTTDIEDTAEDRERRRRQSFRFAYVFTLTTLVVLIFPVTNPWQPDLLGPISLIRGCVDAQRDNTVPMSIRCGNDDLVAANATEAATDNAASGAAAQGAAASATIAASATEAASGSTAANAPAIANKPATAKGASSNDVAGGAASEVASAASAASATGGAGFSRRINKREGFTYEPSYPWLVVIGGTYATSAELPKPPELPKQGKVATPRSGASTTQVAGTENSQDTAVMHPSRKPYQVVEGGFVVPYYVVLLAMLGGAIALTRKIPEYQKRSEPDYVPTQEQPPLDDRTVREQVVFQIMQLITAPFISMVAFYSFAPSTVATGIALGFISGFSSELVLLQIRSVVEALHPTSSPNVAATTVRNGTLKGIVHRADDPNKPTPVPNATVSVQGTDLTTQTDTSGGFAIAKVPVGPHVLTASEGKGETVTTGTQAVTVSAATETTVDIIIKKV